MNYRALGKTGLQVSELSFGAGPVSGLMTEGSLSDRCAVVARALSHGINWFDTAATYGAGKSEAHLGEVLSQIRVDFPVHIATKARLLLEGHETDLRPLIVSSVRESLGRLRVPRVTLLQLHNSVTVRRNDEPTSVTIEDVLGPRGVLAAMQDLRAAGLVDHFGLTGIGAAEALREVLRSGEFATIQAPFHLLNPSSLIDTPSAFPEPDYRGFLQDASDVGMGIFAIRVYAAGALLGAPPSAHTHKTPFFPLALYQRDQARAQRLAARLGSATALREVAVRYVLTQPQITSAILGFGHPEHIDEAIRIQALGGLTRAERSQIETLMRELVMEEGAGGQSV